MKTSRRYGGQLIESKRNTNLGLTAVCAFGQFDAMM